MWERKEPPVTRGVGTPFHAVLAHSLFRNGEECRDGEFARDEFAEIVQLVSRLRSVASRERCVEWWRRRESNPRPKKVRRKRLRV